MRREPSRWWAITAAILLILLWINYLRSCVRMGREISQWESRIEMVGRQQ